MFLEITERSSGFKCFINVNAIAVVKQMSDYVSVSFVDGKILSIREKYDFLKGFLQANGH